MTNNRTQSFSPTPSTARHTRRIALALLLAVSTACSSALAGGPSRAASKPPRTSPVPSSVAPPQTSSMAPSPTTTAVTDVGQQAFATYQQAFTLLNQLEASPTGRSTDPRLPQLLMQPFFSEEITHINELRSRQQVVKGSYSFSNFQLSQVTSDGRVIFFDCETNSQELYDSRTGTQLTNSGTAKINEQVVVARGADGAWRLADLNIKTGNACGA